MNEWKNCNLNTPLGNAQLLGSQIKQWNLLDKG